YVRAHEPERARAAVKDPAGCTLDPEPWRASWRIDLGRLSHDRAELTEARQLASAAAAFPGATRAQRDLGYLLQSEAELDLGVVAAEDELRRRIDQAGDVADAELRSGIARARQVLALAALSRGDGPRALAELAQLQQTKPPGSCAAGFVSDIARAGWISVGPDGIVHSSVVSGLDSIRLPPSEVDRLRQCNGPISVLLAGDRPLDGALPDTLAWAYRVGGVPVSGAPGKERLLVRDVLPPGDLQLPALGTSRLP